MNNKLNKAVEDISLIKDIINMTNKNFTSFSKIFMFWGILFIFNSIYNLYLTTKSDFSMLKSNNFLVSIVPLILIITISIIIFKLVTKNKPLIGLEKQLMIVWILILFMNVIPPEININTPISDVGSTNNLVISVSHTAPIYFSLAIGLIATYLFTSYKGVKRIGILYIVLSILLVYGKILIGPGFTSFFNGLNRFLGFIALPGTFVFLGFYLKRKELRGD